MIPFDQLAQLQSNRQPFALCSVIATKGSTPRKIGSKMIVLPDETEFGRTIQTIGGGAVEHEIRKRALHAIQTNRPSIETIALTQELAMCCGGQMTIFIEPWNPPSNLYLFGAGHINQWVAYFTKPFGYNITVLDPRQKLLAHPHFSHCQSIPDYQLDDIQNLALNESDLVLVATHDHQKDQEIIERLIHCPLQYLGLVGSKRKALMTKERLVAKNIKQFQIDRIFCPAGSEANCETPQAIALSIATQMTSAFNRA